MTGAVQPDLFGAFDDDAALAEAYRQPHTCPSCGTTEPNAWLLRNNHGYDPDTMTIGSFPQGHHPIYGAHCVAQHLITNHIVHATRQGKPIDPFDLRRAAKLGVEVPV